MATCRGIDVSAYQGTQDWSGHKRDGVVFAFAKASEGQTTHDPKFATHITGIIAAGLVPGAYHFAWPNQSAAREAANYITAVKPYAGRGFTHWLDLERYSDGRNYRGRSAAQIRAWVTAWVAAVQEAFPGQRVGIYTSASDITAGHVPDGLPLWYPAYPWGPAAYSRAESAAQPKPSGRAPIIWQFTSQPMDRSIAYMSASEFRTWAAGTTTHRDAPEENDVPHPISRHDSTDRTLVPGKWTTLPIDGVDLLTGATCYQAMAHVQASIPAGSTLQGRFYHYRPDGTRWTGPLIERIGTTGSTFADFHNSGSIVSTERVRLEVIYYPADSTDKKSITITAAQLRGLYWK